MQASDDDVDFGASPPPIPPKSRTAATPPPRRLRSGSGSGGAGGSKARRGVRERTASGGGSAGIVVGGMRRRLRSASARVESSDEGGDEQEEGEENSGSSSALRIKPKKAARQPSLLNVATLVRSNVRKSLREKLADEAAAAATSTDDGGGADDDGSEQPPSARKGSAVTFAGVAHQVVTSKRAAKGFLSMWAKDAAAVAHVHKGIHMEKKKLELKTVAAEYKELKRRQFYQELLVYLGFLTLFFATLAWLPVEDSYLQNDVVGAVTCREQGVCELSKFSDLYGFAAALADHVCAREGVTSQWVRVGGVRFRQVRVREQQCQLLPGWRAPCFPAFDAGVEETAPIPGRDGRVYAWRDGLGPLQPQLYQSVLDPFTPLESFGRGGYAVDLCRTRVEDLQADDWIALATRALSIEFTLVNPVTRVFTVGLHVFTIDPSGHLEHFPQSSNLRVIGLEASDVRPDGDDENGDGDANVEAGAWLADGVAAALRRFDHRVLLWAGLIAFLITYIIGEASEMGKMGASAYLKSDMWNVFELSHLTLLAFLIVYMARFYTASTRFAADLHAGLLSAVAVAGDGDAVGPSPLFTAAESADYSSAQLLLRNFQRLSDIAALASAVSLLKVFKFLRMNSTLNLLWRVLGMAMRDLMGFLVIFNLIFLGYSAMGSYAFGFALEEFSSIAKSYGTCFQMLAGEVDYARLSQANPRLAPVFLGTFVVLVFQILVNMFVAILSEYYESAKNDDGGDDIEYDVLTRVRNYLSACAPTVVAGKNEVVRLIPGQPVRLISTNLVDQEETRQRARKLFRGVVWRVVALLRFGMKFDRRINFGPAKASPHANAGKDKDQIVTHIRLSENFDHKTIKDMIPTGITIRLKGDSLLGDGIALEVVRHNKLSVECVVLDNDNDDDSGGRGRGGAPGRRRRHPRTPLSLRQLSVGSSFEDSDASDAAGTAAPPRERVLELLGGEKLRIPWRMFAFHVLRSILKELRMSLLRATKLWNYSKAQLVDDYHLALLFDSVRADGRTSLRFDEVYRMLDLFLRQDRRKRLCTQAEVRHEALEVMYRFRKCLIDMPSREKEGHNYRPKPVDTSAVDLGPLAYLSDMLARNCHDMWALERLKQGWVYGAQRNDAGKQHPNLIPYKLLSDDEKAFDFRSSLETLKTIVFMNYSIARVAHAHSGSFQDAPLSRSQSMASDSVEIGGNGTSAPVDESAVSPLPPPPLSAESKGKKPVPALLREAMSFRRNSLMEDSPYFTTYGADNAEVYRPLPIDTSGVELPPRLIRLVDLLAENAHEVWAKGRMEEGWTYGPQRDDATKKHPCLVPYIFLTDDEKEYDLNIAKETLKTLLAMKFTLVDRSSKF